MKLMNEEGLLIEKLQSGEVEYDDKQINKEFEERLDVFVKSYLNSSQTKNLDSRCNAKIEANAKNFNVSVFQQWWLILGRSFISEMRNPLDVRLKILQSIIFGVVSIIVFEGLGNG
jgi:hypothetical protein